MNMLGIFFVYLENISQKNDKNKKCQKIEKNVKKSEKNWGGVKRV